jgi:MFS family permease
MSDVAVTHPSQDESAYRRFLKCYYLTHFWYDFIFAYAIYTLYFSLRGMSVFAISLLLTWWSIAAMAAEVPTGALADSWSRRKMLVLAPLIKALCFVTWYFADGGFYLLALGFLLWAIGSAFRSGTSEALLYDTLVHHGKADDYEQILGKRKFYVSIGGAISTISGGFVASYRIDWAILFSVAPLLLSAFHALRMEEAPKVRSTEEIHYLQHIRLALREMRSNKVLLYLTLYLWGVSVFGATEEFDQLYYRLAGLPIIAFGVVSSVWFSCDAVAARLAYRLKQRASVLYALPVASALLLVVVFRFPSVATIGLLLLACALTTPARVLAESRVQHAITGVSRATVTSAIALLLEIPVLCPSFGLIAKAWGLPAIYLASAMLLFAVTVWAFGMRKRMEAKPARGTAAEERREGAP